eukprot:TRINITY_DN76957_c0_g1_i1.p1 TRINITY_DN76957_c0_g1~~TRINITY_DN76957_c0_g1_i1.p1  ORF type:complete len:193 (-),score=55.91 TRINITY_DN76957_c0_g1_i1:67-645(-)
MDDFAPATTQGADNLLAFTESAPAAAPDPMQFVAGNDTAPPAMGMGMGTPPAAGGYVDPFQGMPVKDSVGGGAMIPEMNALREWEAKHEEELETAARKEASEKEERRRAATAELAKWNEEREGTSKKRMATNRSNEEASEKAKTEASKPGANPWERVADLIDTSAKSTDDSRDTSRMRNLLIQLKSNPVVTA